MLDVKRLQVLLSVVELGSVTAAADALVYTPSAVSQQLRRLEREVGQPLLRRHARGMSPTDAGLVLAAHARTVLRQLSAAEADLAEIAGLRQGRLALGTFPTVASSFLPLAVHRFSELHPAIRLDIRSERQPQLIEWLENGTVDLSLLWDYQWQRLDSAQLDLTELFSDPTVLLVSSEHRLAQPVTERPGHLAGHQRRRPPGARRAPPGPGRLPHRGRLPQAPGRDRSRVPARVSYASSD
jgi:DNA-binding transcriptional LysR family regulator